MSILTKVEEIQAILNYLRRHLTVFPSDFNNIYLKYFGILQNLTRNYKILWKFTIVYESYDIPQYFFGQIPCFRSISFTCDVVFAFCNFVRWWTKFSCLLSFHIASRQYRQIFCHRHRPGISSNIADTYWEYLVIGYPNPNNVRKKFMRYLVYSNPSLQFIKIHYIIEIIADRFVNLT